MKQVKRIVGLIISLILIVLFCHPEWLPLPEKTAGTMQSLFDGHFLLRGDAGITVAHVLHTKEDILPLAKQLIHDIDYSSHPIRLLGLGVSNSHLCPHEKSSHWVELELEFEEW